MDRPPSDRLVYGLPSSFGPAEPGGVHRKMWPASATADAEGGWTAEIVRYPSADPPGLVAVITATSPGPSPWEILESEARAGGRHADLASITVARHAAVTADLQDTAATEPTPLRLVIPVAGRRRTFTGFRVRDSWVVSAVVASHTVLIVGVQAAADIPALLPITPPAPITRRPTPAPAFASHGAGWRVIVDQPVSLIIALHVRDAADLANVGPYQVPRLSPAVPPQLRPTEFELPTASAEWAAWWHRLVQALDPADTDHHVDPGPLLASLLEVDHDAAVAWAAHRKREYLTSSAARPTMPEQLLLRQLGARLDSSTQLRISILPVAGLFGLKTSPRHVIVSPHLRADPTRYQQWILRNLG